MIILILCLLFVTVPGAAHDHTQPGIKSWIKSLKNKQHVPCCDTADGYPPEAVVDMGGNRYRVKIKGEWYDVPDHALLTEPNRLGYPVVWYVHENGRPLIVCFLPGAGG
jgi:hypothetical protein